MDVHIAIRTRREITEYEPTPLRKEDLRQVVEAGYLSVTGNNLPSRELIVVEETAALKRLSHATPFMPWLNAAPAAVVVVGNPKESKYWLQDATIATSNMWLVATELNVGAAWGALHHSEDAEECARREQWVRDVLDIPASMRPVSILGLGYPAVHPDPKELPPVNQIVHREVFGKRVERIDQI